MINTERRYTATLHISSTSSTIPDDQPTQTNTYIGREPENVIYINSYVTIEDEKYFIPKIIIDEIQRKHVLKKTVPKIRHFINKPMVVNQRRNLRANKRDCKWQHLQS